MPPVSFCLDAATLERHCSGRIAEPERSQLEAHIQRCERCKVDFEAQFAPLLEALRTSPPPETEEEAEILARLIASLKVNRPSEEPEQP